MMTSDPIFRLTLSALLILGLEACSKSAEEPEVQAPVQEVAESVEAPQKDPSPADIDLSARPPKLISAFNFFKDPANQVPNEGVIAYSLNNELFADYAAVKRFFWLPTGTTIAYDTEGQFQFPEGTILLQTFSFSDAAQPTGERLIETRLLMNAGGLDGWDSMIYRWNDEMSDAKRTVAGGLIQLPSIHADAENEMMNYLIPNKNECSRCHENNDGMSGPLGFTARNLSLPLEGKNQLTHWIEKGLLMNAPETAETFPASIVWDDPETASTETRARVWLDTNCAYCHNPNGSGSVSGLDLSITQNNPVSVGMYKPPVAAGRGSEGFRFSIDPGSPDTSFIVNRLRSTDPSVMMPPLGRMSANAEAIELISQWIAEIQFTEEEAQQLIVEQKEILQKRLQEAGGKLLE